jgi:hypothetical protein
VWRAPLSNGSSVRSTPQLGILSPSGRKVIAKVEFGMKTLE